MALALATGGVAAVQAQLNPGNRGMGLDKDELAQMGAAAGKLYREQRAEPGTTEQWQSASGTTGTVRLVRNYEYEGMPCAHLQHQVQRARGGDLQEFTIDWCHTPDGEWKIR